ncbi:MAG: aminotransferase class III-fold pyridoxal phosphate-dependent enzyme, partial [Clostridiales Family XIII bacterium]|nr:aminotransferase class III-fold pyridoxal phosphate-dependent enzyme [Clostridiales Family XIII bacterium]
MLLKEANLTAEKVRELTQTYMVETYERFPFVAERAEGMYLYDENGTGWLDFYGGIAVNSMGSCHPKVVKAVQEQVAQVMHTFNYPYTAPQALLAKLICDTLGFDKIFYQNSGTESNEAMIKMARKYGVDNFGPNRYHIVTAKNSFHGRSYGAMSATGQPDNACQLGFKPVVPGFTYADFNDLESFKAAVTDDTIAIMLEPIQGEGGVIPGTVEFFQGIEKLCREKNMLLLIDE